MKILIPLSASLLLLTSCVIKGKTIRDVPALNPQKINVTQLKDLPGKTLSLAVVDSRKEDIMSAQLRNEVTRAVTEALSREGTQVQAQSKNELVLTILDFETKDYKEGCVKIGSALTLDKKAKVNTEASSCFETKSPFGQKMGADISAAYEEALNLTFKNLNEGLSQLPPQ
ncbi:hypothetical protein [Bdellovibrio sp. HCB2-146]|uniref:hypothetical protein n=1 Tax=Bdellovibrio sp. HCB2-146 TaxID=3394362 RepID=UPI0039BD070C